MMRLFQSGGSFSDVFLVQNRRPFCPGGLVDLHMLLSLGKAGLRPQALQLLGFVLEDGF